MTYAMSAVGGTIWTVAFSGAGSAVDGYSCVAPGGTLAGSSYDVARGMRIAIDMLEASLADAGNMASHTSARMIGLDDRLGWIAAGVQADFVDLDEQLCLTATWNGDEPEVASR